MLFPFLVLLFFLLSAGTSMPMVSVNSLIRGNGYVKRNDAPCQMMTKGPWADYVNVTVTPNPPRLDEYVKVTFDAIFKESVWLVTVKWNATLDGSGIEFRGQRVLCDINTKTYLCPAEKGAFRHYEKKINPGYLPQGTYSGQLEALDQYDEVAITIRIDHCTFK